MSEWLPRRPIKRTYLNDLIVVEMLAEGQRLKTLVVGSVSSPITRRRLQRGHHQGLAIGANPNPATIQDRGPKEPSRHRDCPLFHRHALHSPRSACRCRYCRILAGVQQCCVCQNPRCPSPTRDSEHKGTLHELRTLSKRVGFGAPSAEYRDARFTELDAQIQTEAAGRHASAWPLVGLCFLCRVVRHAVVFEEDLVVHIAKEVTDRGFAGTGRMPARHRERESVAALR
jgi:hypothetical protein